MIDIRPIVICLSPVEVIVTIIMEETEDLVATPQFRWLGAVGDSSATVSSLAYDARRDFLWVGDAVGRVSTYSILLDSANDSFTVDAPNMVRYSSFSAASGPVLQIIPSEWSTVVVSPKSLRMISAGGMGQAKAPFPEFNYENNRMSDGFTCGSFLESQLFFGGSSSSISYIYDVAALSSGIASPVTSCDLHCSTVSVASTNETLVAAGSDGRIRLLDAQMRTSTVNGMLSVLKRVEAFSGSITDLCLSEDGRTAVACGMLKRAINPYDSNSPFQVCHRVMFPIGVVTLLLSFVVFARCSHPNFRPKNAAAAKWP